MLRAINDVLTKVLNLKVEDSLGYFLVLQILGLVLKKF